MARTRTDSPSSGEGEGSASASNSQPSGSAGGEPSSGSRSASKPSGSGSGSSHSPPHERTHSPSPPHPHPHPHPTSPTPDPASRGPSRAQQATPATHRSSDRDAEGYPAWLPRRPPPPAPASTVPSSFRRGYSWGEHAGGGGYGSGANDAGAGRSTAQSRYGAGAPAHFGHRPSMSYDTGYSAFTYDYVDIGDPATDPDADDDNENRLRESPVRFAGARRGGEGAEEGEGPEETEGAVPAAEGRRQTPRSVRIVSVGPSRASAPAPHHQHRASHPQTHARKPSAARTRHAHTHARHSSEHAHAGARAWWRASDARAGEVSGSTARALTPTAFSPSPGPGAAFLGPGPAAAYAHYAQYPATGMALARKSPARPRARFRAPALQPAVLLPPAGGAAEVWLRVRWLAWPLQVWAHVPVQTFLDFNAVFCLVQCVAFPPLERLQCLEC